MKYLIALLLGSSFATDFNQLPNIFEPAAKDTDVLVHEILKPYFGYGMGIDYSENILSLFSSVFLHGLLVLAAVIIIFQAWTSTVDTGSTGVFLKGKSNGTYTAGRMVFGTGMLIPLGKSGLCAIQYFIVWIAVQGVYLADSIWEKYATNPFVGQVVYSSAFKSRMLENIQNVFLAQVCVDEASSYGGETSSGKDYGWEIEKKNFAKGDMFTYGYKNGGRYDKSICGRVDVSYKFTDDKDRDLSRVETPLVKINEMNNLIQEAHKKNIQELVNKDVIDLSKFYLENKNNDTEEVKKEFRNKLQAILDRYSNDIVNSYKGKENELLHLNENQIKEMQRDGVAGVGSWFFVINKNLSSVTTAVNNAPIVTLIKSPEDEEGISSYDGIDGGLGASYYDPKSYGRNESRLNKVNKAIIPTLKKANKFFTESENGINLSFTDSSNKIIKQEEDKDDWITSKLLSNFKPQEYAGIFDAATFTTDKQKDKNPLMIIQDLGSSMVGVTLTGFAGLGLVAFLTGGEKVMSVLLVWMMPLFALGSGLLIPGVMMGFYIPLLPFILWMGALFGWLILIVEAMVGAPLWLIMFLTKSQDSFLGRQEQGIMLIVSLMLKLPLMVGGFIMANALLGPTMHLLNKFYAFAANTILAETSVITLVYWVASIIIYYVIINKTVGQVFSLIHKLPDNILQWTGTNLSNVLGQYSGALEQGVAGSAQSGLGIMRSVQDSGREAASNALRTANDNRLNKEREINKDADALRETINSDNSFDRFAQSNEEDMTREANNGLYSSFDDYKATDKGAQKEELTNNAKDAARLAEMEKVSSFLTSNNLSSVPDNQGLGEYSGRTKEDIMSEKADLMRKMNLSDDFMSQNSRGEKQFNSKAYMDYLRNAKTRLDRNEE